MMSRTVKIIVSVVGWSIGMFIGRAVFGCECVDKEDEFTEYTPLKIAFVGDSITTGAYPQMVVDTLLAWQFGVEHEVFAKSGADTGVALGGYYTAIEGGNPRDPKRDRRPDYVVLFIGINDCFGYNPSFQRTVEEDSDYIVLQIQQMARRAFSDWVRPIIVLHHNWDAYIDKHAKYPKQVSKCTFLVNEKLRGLSGKGELWDARLIDPWGYDPRWGMKDFTVDGLHLDYDGHETLAAMITDDYLWMGEEEWECF